MEYKDIIDMLPNSVELIYVDYRDSFDENMDIIQKCIHEGNTDAMYEEDYIDFHEQENYSVDEIITELTKDIAEKYNITEKEANDIVEEYEDEIRDEIYNRDKSDTVKQLFKNTSKQVMFYNTGYELEPDSWNWNKEEINGALKEVKEYLHIKTDKCDEDIKMMIIQASYGGELVIYFYDDVEDYIGIDEKFKTIVFKNPHIAIINTCNGSGDNSYLPGITIKLPLDIKNIFIDKIIKYNYSFEVCGMVNDWCKHTIVDFEEDECNVNLQENSLAKNIEQDHEYQKIFNSGKCSFGDTDMNRHRGVFYKNEFPCGWHCPHCGHFWID